VLVSGTDGVGTKLKLAQQLGRHDSIGIDLVGMCVNDVLVQGAEPLFFLDYFATGKLDVDTAAAVVGGIAEGCTQAGCALIGGETAEMPDVYAPGAFDLAGTIIGVVDRALMLPRADVAPGDAVLALPSSGLHTNGYSLARRIVEAGAGYAVRPAILGGQSVGEALLAVHRCYLAEVAALRAAVELKALAHITGGGLFDNLPRALPEGLGASIRRGSWDIPPIFSYLVEQGHVSEAEAFHALNMGLGMLAVIPATSVPAAMAAVPEARHVGEITATAGVVLV
jgi:phosphoribosylformylglycinamidine cyclo-ligase